MGSEPRPIALEQLISKGLATAKAQQTSVLISFWQPWDCHDGLLFLAGHKKERDYSFYWQHPSNGFTLAGSGSVWVCQHLAGAADHPEHLDSGVAVHGASSTMHPTVHSSPHLRSNSNHSQVNHSINDSTNSNISDDNISDRFRLAQDFMAEVAAHALTAGDPHSTGLNLGTYVLGGFSFYPDPDHGQIPHLTWFVPRWLLRQTATDCMMCLNYRVEPHHTSEGIWEGILQCWHDLTQPVVQPVSSSAGRLRVQEIAAAQSWGGTVAQALQQIEQGKLEKVVLARALAVAAESQFMPFEILHRLRCDYPNCMTFAMDWGTDEVFLGATPERLLQFQQVGADVHLQSDAVAGSIKRGVSLVSDDVLGQQLKDSEKDLREHQIVIRSIAECLRAAGAEVNYPNLPALLKLSNVQHLYTPLQGIWRNQPWLGVFDLVAQLHPTAAVGGEPRQAALNFMQSVEACDRGWYAAPLGWVHLGADRQGEGVLAVAIRSGYITGKTARLFAGAGIVGESQINNEQLETSIKFAALLHALGLDDLDFGGA
ncbi:MAG: isochorismate synthase MenF [Pseudanabaenaceae cyanobacterium]